VQPFSWRIGKPQLIASLTQLLRAVVNRLAQRMAHRRTKAPIRHTDHDVQAELEQKLSAMQQALDQQALLLRITVHDLRMPLTSIQGYTELLRHGMYGPLADEQAAVLQKIAYSTLSLERLVSSLLDTISVEALILKLARETFDPAQLAQQVLEDCYPQAERQGLTLQFHSVGDLPALVGDPNRVRQVLFNLLGNALRYTNSGCITVAVEALPDVVEFHVTDTGIGIPYEMQELIWKPFTRASSNGEGLGIGLYTVQQLTQAMGGSVGMQSTPGTGSVFWIRLPYQERGKAVGDNNG
jgi:signal transduction histidine kinase